MSVADTTDTDTECNEKNEAHIGSSTVHTADTPNWWLIQSKIILIAEKIRRVLPLHTLPLFHQKPGDTCEIDEAFFDQFFVGVTPEQIYTEL